MKRREFISLFGSSAAAWPLGAHAQEKADDLPKIGILHSAPNENFEALTEGLREARYIDGQNVLLEKRFFGAGLDRIEAFAKELRCTQVQSHFGWCAVCDPGCVESDK